VNHIEKDLIQKRIEIANWIFLAALFIPSLIFAPFKFALGVLLGGFISIINFHWLSRSLQSAFQNLGDEGNIKTPVMFKYGIRLVVTGIVLFLLITGGAVSVVGLIVGLSVVVINIIITLIVTTFAKKNCLEEVI
jgi:hypothetical protein